MSARDWYPGQHVVCVDDQWEFLGGNHTSRADDPVKGNVYVVSDADEVYGFVFIALAGVRGRRNGRPEYEVSAFRPLDEARLDVFRKALKPQPKKVEA